MQIRKVRPDEWEQLRDLNVAVMEKNPEYDEDLIVDFAHTPRGERFFQEAIEREDGVCLVAEIDGRFIGYVSGGHKDIPYRKSKYFEIGNFGVLAEVKGKGVAKKLLDTITAWAKDQGYQKIYIECYAKNQEALSFYRKHGYGEIDVSLEREI